MKKIVVVLVVIVLAFSTLCGCRESDKVSYNISQQADAFNVPRKIT